MLFTLCILFHNAIHFVYFISLCILFMLFTLCILFLLLLCVFTLGILFHYAIHFVYFVS